MCLTSLDKLHKLWTYDFASGPYLFQVIPIQVRLKMQLILALTQLWVGISPASFQ